MLYCPFKKSPSLIYAIIIFCDLLGTRETKMSYMVPALRKYTFYKIGDMKYEINIKLDV